MGTAFTAVVAGTAARRPKASALRAWSRLQVLYGVICPPAAALIILAFWPMWRDRPLLALASVVLSMALLSAGILLLDEPSQQPSAGMLIGASVLLTAGWLNNWRAGPLPLISVPASVAGIMLAAWAMYSYPHSPNEKRAGRRFFGTVLGFLLAAEVACILVSRPQWWDFPASAWWPSLMPNRGAFQAVSLLFDLAGVGFAVAYMLLWLGRWRRSRGISRRLAKPVATAASVTCAATAVELVATALSVSPHAMNAIFTVEAYLQIGVPAAFVVSVLQRRFARTRVADLILHLRGPARASSITGALREILEDSELEVVLLEPSGQAPPTAGQPSAGTLVSTRGRSGLPVTATSGDQLAVIVADPALSMEDDLVRAAVAATAFALENAQLEAALTDRLREVHQSRLRIIQAETTERRRLERDLHDGTQQRLVAISIMLGAAGTDTTEEPVRAILNRAGAELAQVIEELRDLAHGIHPGVLHQVGLEKAIRTMAERYPFPIDVALPPGRFSDGAELTAYYVIAEAISNAVKHARARRITISGEASNDWLSIAVSDDGRGGARADAGTGISGIIDRVRAIDGEAGVDSAPGHGTRIWARIPCA
jgi:signal transduction histidine kinase